MKAAGPSTRSIVVVAFPDAQILDVVGPLEVFSTANRVLEGANGASAPAYRIGIAATRNGPVRMSNGIEIGPATAQGKVRFPIDTLLVAGGQGTRAAAGDRTLIDWIRRAAPRARRVASVCTGAFLLAEAGLLDGRRATTHWASCDLLARRYPRVKVDPDPIFVRDGRLFTSAGVTSGMDLALALVEEDHGREPALTVARWLVVFLKRPGGQSQFSAQLAAQIAEREPLRDLQAWILDHPAADGCVRALARRAAMSPRHFARVFTAETGLTPARFVERARVEAARRLLEQTSRSIEAVASAAGFGSAESMRRAFLRTLRVGPAAYRGRFRTVENEKGVTL